MLAIVTGYILATEIGKRIYFHRRQERAALPPT
jgi:hypothetical protein